MKSKWLPITVLALAQFVMVLDSTVMNVSISTVVNDLHTTVTSMQAAITFYTLTMASLMLIGGKLGDIWGRKRALIIGAVIYAAGSFTTAISRNFATLFIGWSIIEGIGAILVIPAIASLTASNYEGKDRIKAYALIGAVAGGAAAAGPLIGGFVTTYLSWRFVFLSEVVIMFGILPFTKYVRDITNNIKTKIDIGSAILSVSGIVLLVFGILQTKTWGLIEPRTIPVINGMSIAPFGISISAYIISLGILIIYLFIKRQYKLEAENNNPLFKMSLLKSVQLRSGLSVLTVQYLIIGSVFFIIPVYLQMTLGLNALSTGLKILPLSIALILFSILGARLTVRMSPRKIIRFGQLSLVFGILCLLSSIDITLQKPIFSLGMFVIGLGIGLLASQIGNVNMSSAPNTESSEIGGAQGVFQNLGSSLGTAIIGSVLIATLTTSFTNNVQSSTLPSNVKDYINSNSKTNIQVAPVNQVESYAFSKGANQNEAEEIATTYADSQINALRYSLFVLLLLSIVTIPLSKNIPDKILK